MVDNVTSPTATAFATDDISSVHYPRIKLIHGADGTNDGDVANTNPLPVSSTPFAAILEVGLTELIGEDSTTVAASGEYSNTADLSLGGTYSGEILSFVLVSHENGSGAVQTGKGVVFFFDADPNVSAGDTDLALIGAEHATIVGMIPVEADEWDADATPDSGILNIIGIDPN